jgi:hypothetical protein
MKARYSLSFGMLSPKLYGLRSRLHKCPESRERKPPRRGAGGQRSGGAGEKGSGEAAGKMSRGAEGLPPMNGGYTKQVEFK